MPPLPEPPARLTEPEIRRLVALFYARIRQDPELGPIFNRAIHDWPDHLAKLTDFWSAMMLGTGRYQGNPMQAHARQRAHLSPALFNRWLALWRETSAEILSPAAAAAVQERAARMASSLQRGLAL